MKSTVRTIVDSIGCVKHKKTEGEPCFTIPSYESGMFWYNPIGICNHRAKLYGCIGKISKESLSRPNRGGRNVR